MKENQVIKFRVGGMDCANCALTLERSLAQIKGMQSVQVNFSTAILEAVGEFDLIALEGRVQALGYQVIKEQDRPAPVETMPGVAGFIHFLFSKPETTIAAGAAILLIITSPLTIFSWHWAQWVLTLVHWGVVLLAGIPIIKRGLKALWYGRTITIDLLMSIATIGAIFIGETGEAAAVILLFALGEALEGFSAERARRTLHGLLSLKPTTADVLRSCMDCAEHIGREGYQSGPCPYCGSHPVTVPVEDVAVGEIVLIRPGESIPVDGIITSGFSFVNQASITGESMPEMKQPGEIIFAGTLNGEGALEIEVTHPAQDTMIARIVRLVEQAQSKRSPVERFIDRFAAWYTPSIVAAAVLTAVIPVVFFAQPLFDLPDGTHGWLYRSLALLIVACPCALVISTPVTVVSTLSGLAKKGILVKGGEYLDQLTRVRVFAFDKTGTLTEGKPTVIQTWTASCEHSHTERCQSCDSMLLLAASVENRSEHPIAQAVLNEVLKRDIKHRIPKVSNVKSLTGRAIQGWVGGNLVTIGSHSYIRETFVGSLSLHDRVEIAHANGQTVMLVCEGTEILGYIGVADKVRHTSQLALTELKSTYPDSYFVMLTGDHPEAGRSIGENFNTLDEIRANLLPDEKVSVIHSLLKEKGPTAMIGDGINDAPALASASIGIAMGAAGSTQAMETADIVLMHDNLTHLTDLVHASRKNKTVIWQNIAFSLIVKAMFMVFLLPGFATMWMAVFADMGASLLVTLNGMRMLKVK